MPHSVYLRGKPCGIRHIGRRGGGGGVSTPNNAGDILAMASVPSFDPNVFIPSVSAEDWKKLNTDEAIPAGQPLR